MRRILPPNVGWFFGISAIVAMIFTSCSVGTVQTAGGTTTETTNGVMASVRRSDGSYAADATVRLRRNDYVTQPPSSFTKSAIYVADALTDEIGRFEISGIDPGSYTIEVNDPSTGTGRGGAVLLTCTLDGHDTVDLGIDTLRPFGTIKGAVDTSGTSGKRLFVQVVALERLASVDTDGGFEIRNLPQGLFALRVIAVTGSQTTVIRTDEVMVVSGDTLAVTLAGWKFSKKLSLNTTAAGANVSGNVHEFPVLIRLTANNFDFSQASPTGSDIRFTKRDNTPLSYEIEQWDQVAQSADIWVTVDTIFGNDSSQYITMVWGAATGAATVSLSAAAAVFDTMAGFQGVWHLNEPTGATALDATGNHYDGTPFGSLPPSQVAGAVGAGQRFDGAADYFQMSGTANGKLNFPQNGTYAISAWVFADTLDEYFRTIASKGDYQYNLEVVPSDEWQFAEYNDGRGWDMTTSAGQKKTWTYLTGIRLGNKEYLYVNGRLADSSIFLNTSTIRRYAGFDFMIGRNRNPANDTTGFFFKGIIDEVRVTSVAPSADWVKLCYMNQKSQDALVVAKQ